MRETSKPTKTYQQIFRERTEVPSGSRGSSPNVSPRRTTAGASAAGRKGPQGSLQQQITESKATQSIKSGDDAATAAAAPSRSRGQTLSGLGDIEHAGATESTLSAQDHPQNPNKASSSVHYLLAMTSDGSTGSADSGTPLQPSPLPVVTSPRLPAAATLESSDSMGIFETPRSVMSDNSGLTSMGSCPDQEPAAGSTLQTAGSGRSPFRWRPSAQQLTPTNSTSSLSAPSGMVAAGVMGSSISLQPRLSQKTTTSSAESADNVEIGPAPAASKTTATAQDAAEKMPAVGAAAAVAAVASTGTGPAGSISQGVGAAGSPSPASKKGSGFGASVTTGMTGLVNNTRAWFTRSTPSPAPQPGPVAQATPEIQEQTSRRSQQAHQQQKQQQAVASLTADIIAAAAAGAAAGAALAAIAEVEDKKQQQSRAVAAAKSGAGVWLLSCCACP